jgi:AraC-like DNA-binding protein
LWLVASSVVSVLFYLTHTSPPLLDGMICAAAAMVLYTALFGLALWSSRDDLVECRCKARPGFAAAIAGLGMVLTGLEVFGPTITPSGLISLLQPAGTFAVAAAFAVWILRPDLSRWPGENEDTRPTPSIADPQTADLDPALTSRVTAAMEDGIWREEGLTIGALAARLSVPEHRLRRVINGGLGHRNFSSFINTARIEAAKQRLRDPSECGTTVLEIAYDVGFASLGPFNRAFRTETGQSPTEYRKDASGLHADSEHHAPMPANLH